MIEAKVYCVSGIDTGIGKTIATGLLACSFAIHGVKAISQKIVQTGCLGLSEDILCHRRLMGIEPLPLDYSGLTCPYVFPVPCSPHLAARLAGQAIDTSVLRRSIAELGSQYEVIFLEGAGGLAVPLTEDYTFLDFVTEEKYPLILVTCARLGSINHTLAALELAYHRKIKVEALIYNRFFDTDQRIAQDSREIFAKYLKKYGFPGRIIDLHPLDQYDQKGKPDDLYTCFL
ncbi:MAG: dethiobiotin synthase [Desulforhopalus sp.]|nr:dethiobiotin synthase [Desulforhopalus sp.]